MPGLLYCIDADTAAAEHRNTAGDGDAFDARIAILPGRRVSASTPPIVSTESR